LYAIYFTTEEMLCFGQMSGRVPTEEVAEILPTSISEIRQMINEATDQMGISRNEAIQRIIDSIVMEQRTPSQMVAGVVGGIDSVQGRMLLNFALSWNEKSVDELVGLGGSSDLDENSLRVETFAKDVNVTKQQAEQILRLAREETERAQM
jgi:hypothetical protein